MRILLCLTILLLVSFEFSSASLHGEVQITSSDPRDFKPLVFGDKDYFLSKQTATVAEAQKTCQSIGRNFNLVTFESDAEYRLILPYLRSFENITRVWTSGRKSSVGTSSVYEWTVPLPAAAMNYTNFPSSAMLAKLMVFKKQGKQVSKLPRCKNGLLTPKCSPPQCNVTLPACETVQKDCFITSEKNCTVSLPDCGADCNNCVIENPVCQIVQKPCVVTPKPCNVIKPNCTIQPPICETSRPPCITTYPPCEVTTPKPCTTTTKPCQTVCTTTRRPCTGGRCLTGKPNCRSVCQEPEICIPQGVIICPPPIVVCPPEETVCCPAEVNCGQPIINCPEPDVLCPEPTAVCSAPKITCDAPEINCQSIVVNCPKPSYFCPTAEVSCPKPVIDCEDFIPCEYPEQPLPCPTEDPEQFIDDSDEDNTDNETNIPEESECDDCKPSGCIALRKDTDFKWKLEDCSQSFHFICEGTD